MNVSEPSLNITVDCFYDSFDAGDIVLLQLAVYHTNKSFGDSFDVKTTVAFEKVKTSVLIHSCNVVPDLVTILDSEVSFLVDELPLNDVFLCNISVPIDDSIRLEETISVVFNVTFVSSETFHLGRKYHLDDESCRRKSKGISAIDFKVENRDADGIELLTNPVHVKEMFELNGLGFSNNETAYVSVNFTAAEGTINASIAVTVIGNVTLIPRPERSKGLLGRRNVAMSLAQRNATTFYINVEEFVNTGDNVVNASDECFILMAFAVLGSPETDFQLTELVEFDSSGDAVTSERLFLQNATIVKADFTWNCTANATENLQSIDVILYILRIWPSESSSSPGVRNFVRLAFDAPYFEAFQSPTYYFSSHPNDVVRVSGFSIDDSIFIDLIPNALLTIKFSLRLNDSLRFDRNVTSTATFTFSDSGTRAQNLLVDVYKD